MRYGYLGISQNNSEPINVNHLCAKENHSRTKFHEGNLNHGSSVLKHGNTDRNGIPNLRHNFPFRDVLEVNGLRHIRFHDLRHSCASILLANGVHVKQNQEWQGHSDFSTTANIYAHLDYCSKLTSAEAMIAGLAEALNQIG